MDQIFSDIKLLNINIVTIVAVITAGVGIFTWLGNLYHRKREYVLNQAIFAKEIIDEMFEYEGTKNVFRMIEKDSRIYKEKSGDKYISHRISFNKEKNKILTVLQKEFHVDTYSNKDLFICDCFSDLIFYFDRLESFIEADAVDFELIKSPLNYYIRELVNDKNNEGLKKAFLKYLAQIKTHNKAICFLERFDEWKESETIKNLINCDRKKKKWYKRIWPFCVN